MPIPVGLRVAAALLLGLPVGVAVAAGAGHGALDPSFGNRGVVTMPNLSDTSSSVYALAVQRDGKLVAAGGGGVGFIVARFNRNG